MINFDNVGNIKFPNRLDRYENRGVEISKVLDKNGNELWVKSTTPVLHEEYFPGDAYISSWNKVFPINTVGDVEVFAIAPGGAAVAAGLITANPDIRVNLRQ